MNQSNDSTTSPDNLCMNSYNGVKYYENCYNKASWEQEGFSSGDRTDVEEL